MSWIKRLLGREEASGSVAKQRLQMVLVHDRSDLSPGLLELIKDDIIEVISRRMDVDVEQVQIHVEQDVHENRLIAEIPLINKRRGRRPTATYS